MCVWRRREACTSANTRATAGGEAAAAGAPGGRGWQACEQGGKQGQGAGQGWAVSVHPHRGLQRGSAAPQQHQKHSTQQAQSERQRRPAASRRRNGPGTLVCGAEAPTAHRCCAYGSPTRRFPKLAGLPPSYPDQAQLQCKAAARPWQRRQPPFPADRTHHAVVDTLLNPAQPPQGDGGRTNGKLKPAPATGWVGSIPLDRREKRVALEERIRGTRDLYFGRTGRKRGFKPLAPV